jgi:hypothetical protein
MQIAVPGGRRRGEWDLPIPDIPDLLDKLGESIFNPRKNPGWWDPLKKRDDDKKNETAG